MSAMLWKTAALVGVMGVGSVVVWQAQKGIQSLQSSRSVADEFPPFDAEGDEDLDDLLADVGGPAGDLTTASGANAGGAAASSGLSAADDEAAGLARRSSSIPRNTAAAAPADIEDFADGEFDWDNWGQTEPEVNTATASTPSSDSSAANVSPASGETAGGPSSSPARLNSVAGAPVLLSTPGEQDDDEPHDSGNPFAGFPTRSAATSVPDTSSNPFAFRADPLAVDDDDSPATDVPSGEDETDGLTPEESAALEIGPTDDWNWDGLPESEDAAPAAAPAAIPRSSIPPADNAKPVPGTPGAPAVNSEEAGLSSIPRRNEPVEIDEDGPQMEFGDEPETSLTSPRPLALPDVPESLDPDDEPIDPPMANSPRDNKSIDQPAQRSTIALPGVNLASGDDEDEPLEVSEMPEIRPNVRSSIPQATPEPLGFDLDDEPAASSAPSDFELDDEPAAAPPPRSRSTIPNSPPATAVPEFGSQDDSPATEPAPEPAASPRRNPSRVSPDLIGDGVIDREVSTGPAQPQLTITKQAPSVAVIGQELEYSILVRNAGRSAAHHVVVEDQIPRGSECTATAPKCEAENKKLIWKLGTIAPGGEQLLRVRITPTSSGEIGSITTVSFSAEVAARTTIIEPQAAVALTGPKDVIVGESAPFQITIRNPGDIDLSGLIVRTQLPEGLNHAAGRDLELEIDELPRGKSRTVPLAPQATTKGSWRPVVVLLHRGKELARATADLEVVESRLVISRTGPARRFIGRPAAFTNSVTNTSGKPLTDVTITETIPPGLELVKTPEGGRWDAARRTVTWVIRQLPAGATQNLTCTVAPKTAGALEGRVLAADSAGNRAEVATSLEVAGFSALNIDVSHDGRPIPVGDQVSLRFSVKNRGTAAAEEVQAVFELPDEVRFVNAEGPTAFERVGNLIQFDAIRSVPAGQELQFDVVFQAEKPTIAGDRRVRVSLHSHQLPKDKPLEQHQQIVIFDEDPADDEVILQTSGLR
ncbi:MAG: DUF11 domain-containing protein [Planctomyces sp.]|nr:DUF11 domain-containing protein [Planctomyces sp.]